MAGPIGHPNNQGNGLDQFKAQVKTWIKEEIANAARNGIGLHVDGATGNLIVDLGNAQSGNYSPGVAGWVLHANGDVEFTGNTTIDGTLSLPNASVNNAALVAPVVPGVVNLYVSFFGLGTGAYTEIAGQDLTVPAGCTQLLFDGSAAVECYNPKTTGGNNGVGGDYLYARVKIGAVSSPGDWATGVSGSNGNATATAGYAALITGLTPGSTIRASVYGVSDYGIASASGNLARLNATLIWLR